jgi:hypothetical protein
MICTVEIAVLLTNLHAILMTCGFMTYVCLTGDRRAEDYEEVEQLYQGKASVLHAAKCRVSNIPVALKKYRKERLSNLNWHQARPLERALVLA